jgi:hypothetical protein
MKPDKTETLRNFYYASHRADQALDVYYSNPTDDTLSEAMKWMNATRRLRGML